MGNFALKDATDVHAPTHVPDTHHPVLSFIYHSKRVASSPESVGARIELRVEVTHNKEGDADLRHIRKWRRRKFQKVAKDFTTHASLDSTACHYGLKVCVPLKYICRTLIPNAMISGDGALADNQVMSAQPS